MRGARARRPAARHASPASAAAPWRQQGLVSLFPIDDLAIIGICRDPGAACRLILRRIRETARRRRRRAARRAGHHRQPRFHPSGGAPRARGARRRSRSSTMSRRRSGPGGRAGRAPMRALCRSRAGDPAVRAGGASAARRPALHLCRPSAGRAARRCCAPMRDEAGAGAMPIRRWCWSCRAAGASEIRRLLGGLRRRDRGGGASGRRRSSSCCRRCRISSTRSRRRPPAGRCAPRIVVERGGEMGRVPPRARGARGIRHGHARTRACRRADGARLSSRAARRDRSPRAGASARRHASILANLVLGENDRAGIAAAGLHRRKGSPTRSCRCSPIRRSGGARSRRFARLDAIMERRRRQCRARAPRGRSCSPRGRPQRPRDFTARAARGSC